MVLAATLSLLLSHGPGQVAIFSSMAMKVEKRGHWSAQTTGVTLYGRQTDDAPLCVLAQETITHDEAEAARSFIALANRETAKGYPGQPYGLETEIELKSNSNHRLGLLAKRYTYRGGAHGMTLQETYNFAMVNGKAVRFGLWDALRADPGSKAELKTALLAEVMKTPNTDWVDIGWIMDFEEKQLQRFIPIGTNLVFYFDPYELGSYGAGAFEIKVPKASIAKLVRKNGPLANW
jgi:hypothetical protein